MHLRLDANARQLERRVIVPVNAVDTYDTPMAVAEELGIFPAPRQPPACDIPVSYGGEWGRGSEKYRVKFD